jgi:hypothetical protein
VPVSQTTTFHGRFWSFKGERNAIFSLETARRTVTVVPYDRTAPHVMEWPPPPCEDTSTNVTGRLMLAPDVRLVASDKVQIVNTTNLSGYPVTVSYEPRPRSLFGPVDLDDLENTDTFNGLTPNGIWTVGARLDVLDRPDIGLPVDECITSSGGDFMPPIRIKVELQCTEPPDER